MLADITIDGMVDSEFRQAVETLLREGNADQAAKWLKSRLEVLCGDGLPLPARFLAISPDEVTITGWDEIAHSLERLDAHGSPITAISIDLADPGPVGPVRSPLGRMAPQVETQFYTDDVWPFSHSDRMALMAAYQNDANRWTGSSAEMNDTIGIEGLEDLYGAVLELERRCRPGGDATAEEHRAYMLGASYVAVLIHLAVRETAMNRGLPRAMAVIVGGKEAYPHFDAPVIAAPNAVVVDPSPRRAPIAAPESVEPTDLNPDSDEAEEDYGESSWDHPGLHQLRELTEPDADPGHEPEAWDLPPPEPHVTGTQLRKRIVTPESIAELEAAKKPSLLQRLLRRG